MEGSGMENIGKIHGEPNLASNAGTRDIFASEQPEIQRQTAANGVLPAGHHLELTSS